MSENHLVGVYGHDGELVSAIVSFFACGFRDGGAAVVIATPAHRAALDDALAAAGCPVEVLRASGRYRSLDAEATLRSFMRDGRPVAGEFDRAIGAVLDAVPSTGGSVRLFGEMVGLLWDDGNIGAAIELEALWNDLGELRPFTLFCGYAMSSLESSLDLAAVKQMCDRHNAVVDLHQCGGHVFDPDDCGRDDCGRDDCGRLFVATPKALPGVRGFVRSTLRAWGDDAIGGTAEIIASELATNAVQHAHSPFRISISRSSTAVAIAVRDTSTDLPEELHEGAGHSGGRGVRLVAALANSWGTWPEVDGKTVWAEVTRASTQ